VEGRIEKREAGMTAEDDALLDLLTTLIDEYEAAAYPPLPKQADASNSYFLLEQRGLKPTALWPVIGSKGRASENTGWQAIDQQRTGQKTG
jgi:antitoxin component HigA of HigAB toxin-antitoxin module